jgi:tRNA A-37 threonylcarbamoyl transferase component Bud32
MNVETIDEGRIIAAAGFLPLLRANGLDSFEQVMARPGGNVFRDFPGRRTVRLELKTDAGRTQAVFLKRYESSYLSLAGKWLRRFRWPGTEDEAGREWQMIQQVRALGIRTATPVALGQEAAGSAATRSFLMTVEIPGAVEGITWAEQLPARERRRFLLEVAELARRFHAAGLVHKDFYLGHVLVSREAGGPELFLIDLQRAVRPCCFRARWVAKDLGALAYSMYNAGGSRADVLRCYLAYCGQPGLGDQEKNVARNVLRRVARLRGRQPRHDGPVKQRA